MDYKDNDLTIFGPMENFNEFIFKISKEKHFAVNAEWLLIDRGGKSSELEKTEGVELLENSYILPGSEVTLAQVSADSIQYFDVYRISVETPLKVSLLGIGTRDKLTNLTLRNDRSNFEGALLKAGTVVSNPEHPTVLEDDTDLERSTWVNIFDPYSENLQQQMNFNNFGRALLILNSGLPSDPGGTQGQERILDLTLTIFYWQGLSDLYVHHQQLEIIRTVLCFTAIVARTYGWKVENNSFNGLVGFLEREEIDFGATGVFMRSDRMESVDFTLDSFELETVLLFKKPSLSTLSNIFVLPFTKLVWICCGALSVFVMAVLGIEIIISRFTGMEAYTSAVDTLDIITLVFGLLCQQGSHLMPISISARIALFMFSLSAIFLYTSYSANIVSLLQLTSNSIKTLKDLTESPFKVKVQNRDYMEPYFQTAIDESVTGLYKKKILPHGVQSYCEPSEGIELMRKGTVAYYVELNLGYNIISRTFDEREKCGITSLKLFSLPRLSIPLVKKSGYREIFTQKQMWQREAGIISRLSRYWLAQKPTCGGKRGYRPVGLTDFRPAIMALLYGTGFSVGLFLVEFLFRSKKKLCRLGCWERSKEPKDRMFYPRYV